MRHGLANESWATLLPEVSEWLDRVKIDVGGATVSGAHHVVAVKSGKDDPAAFTLNATALPDAAKRGLEAALKALGWRPTAGATHAVVDGTSYTLVPQTAQKVLAPQAARQLGLDAARATRELKLAHVAFCDAEALPAADVLDGYISGLYSHFGFKGTRKRDAERFPATVSLAGAKVAKDKLAQVVALGRAGALARFLQDAPPNWLNPTKFAEVAKDVARDAGVTCKVLDKAEMQALGMGCMLSVADGSVTEPRLIVIEVPGKDDSRCVALVGKGLTFDAGGNSMKPAAGMEEMKYDMSGASAVLATARFLAEFKPPVRVICVIGATENLVSGGATRPGDIVRAMNGKTVEVLNTDAEGRLVLADCVHYAIANYKPELVVDIATLTGAVLMALGCVGGAVLSNDPDTAKYTLACGEATGEPLWQLPLWPELEKEVKGDVSDLRNIAKPNVKAGTIIGAQFIREFVGDTKWSHLDVAGTAWNCQAVGFPTSGGSAFGMRTMVKMCQDFNR